MTRNFSGAVQLAEACARHDIHLTTFSTDLVFDGTKAAPYVESDPVNPLNTYGRSKALAERRVAQVHPKALVLRTAAFFGPDDAHNFVTVGLRRLAAGGIVTAACDQVVSPTYVPDLADATLDLVVDAETGIWHLTNGEAVTWAELLRRTAYRASVSAGRVRAMPGEQLGTPARRPVQSALASRRGHMLPSLDSAIKRYVTQRCGNRVEQLNR
jgi:dTDP-4-dehydrorhamnose reductase